MLGIASVSGSTKTVLQSVILDVFWYRDGKELIQIGSDERHNLLKQGVMHWLIVSNSQTTDSGMYLCVAINEHGTCQHTFTITVIGRKY